MYAKFAHSLAGDSSLVARPLQRRILHRRIVGGLVSCEMKYSCAIIHSESGFDRLNGFSIAFGHMIWRVSKRSTIVPFLV